MKCAFVTRISPCMHRVWVKSSILNSSIGKTTWIAKRRRTCPKYREMCVVIEMSLYFAHILGIVNSPENKKNKNLLSHRLDFVVAIFCKVSVYFEIYLYLSRDTRNVTMSILCGWCYFAFLVENVVVIFEFHDINRW